jgi:hypothetical protein
MFTAARAALKTQNSEREQDSLSEMINPAKLK